VVKVFTDPVGEQAYERGVRELRAFAAVRSPYLVRVYDAVLEDRFAYAMEYLPLGSLAEPARPLSRRAVLTVLEHAARAAHALHEAGLAHGDIKPANIWLADEGDGRVGGKLADLGLARLLSPGNTMTGMGQASSVEYLDPDLLAGARPSRRSEVWALGATVHRAVADTGLYGELPDAQPLLAIRLGSAGHRRTGGRPSGPAHRRITRMPFVTGWSQCVVIQSVTDSMANACHRWVWGSV
jgi:serine/threonine protein kinase